MMSKIKVDLGEYTQDMYNSGYYVGLMEVTLPIYHILSKIVDEDADVIAALTAMTDIINRATEGKKERQDEIIEKLKDYKFNVQGLVIEVDEVESE